MIFPYHKVLFAVAGGQGMHHTKSFSFTIISSTIPCHQLIQIVHMPYDMFHHPPVHHCAVSGIKIVNNLPFLFSQTIVAYKSRVQSLKANKGGTFAESSKCGTANYLDAGEANFQ